MRSKLSVSLAAVLVLSIGSPGALPQAKKGAAGDGDTNLTERDHRILELFTASTKTFKDGRLVLSYNFESKQQDLVEDWKPALDPKNMRIRWARGIEGTPSTVEHGIIIGDYGEWMHEAVFLADGLEVTIDLLGVAPYKAGTICGPVLYNEKKKMSLGVNSGHQAMVLRGTKLAKPPVPRTERPISATERHKPGFKIRGSVIESYLNGRKTNDTAANTKFTEGFDRGRVGLVWSGSVQSFIFEVQIEGRLDPEWVAAALGEKAPSKKAKEKSKEKAKEKSKEKAAKKAAEPEGSP